MWFACIGAGFFFAGWAFRVSAIKSLGKFWSFHVELKKDHVIVKTGIYRWISHPAYIGNVYLVGVPLFLGAGVSTVVAAVFVVIFGLYRIRLEKKWVLRPIEKRSGGFRDLATDGVYASAMQSLMPLRGFVVTFAQQHQRCLKGMYTKTQVSDLHI